MKMWGKNTSWRYISLDYRVMCPVKNKDSVFGKLFLANKTFFLSCSRCSGPGAAHTWINDLPDGVEHLLYLSLFLSLHKYLHYNLICLSKSMYSILQRFCTFTPPAKVIGYMLQGRWASSWRAVARLAGNHREVLQGGGKVPMIAILLYPNPHVRHKLLGQRNKLVTSSRFHVVAPACPPQTYACSFVAPERRRD